MLEEEYIGWRKMDPSGHGGAGLMVGLDGLSSLFQSPGFYES